MTEHIKLHHRACNSQLELSKFYHTFLVYAGCQAQAKKLGRKNQEHLINHFLYTSLVNRVISGADLKKQYLL